MAIDKTAVAVGLFTTIYEGLLLILRKAFEILIGFLQFLFVFALIFAVVEYFIHPKLPPIKNAELAEKVSQSLKCDFETDGYIVAIGEYNFAFRYESEQNTFVKLANLAIKNLIIGDRDFDSSILSYFPSVTPGFKGNFLLNAEGINNAEVSFNSNYSIIGDERKLSALSYSGKVRFSNGEKAKEVFIMKRVSPVCLK